MPEAQQLLRENMLVTLEFPDRDPGSRYPSRVEWVSADQMALAAPMEGNVAMAVGEGERVSFVTVVGRRAFQAESYVTGRLNAPVPCLLVQSPAEWSRAGRREWFRVQTMFPVRWDPSLDGSMEAMIALSRDLSGGGVRLNIPRSTPGCLVARDLRPGHPVLLFLELPEFRVRCVGELNRKEERDESLELSLRFVAISGRDRERIIRFCFSVQRETLRKGLVSP